MPLSFILFQLLKALIGRFQVILFIYLKCILLILTQKHVLNILNIFNHKALMTRCLQRLVWIFLWNFGCSECVFHQCLFKVVTNIIFYKCCFIKDNLQKHFFIIGWMVSCAPKKSIGQARLGFKHLYQKETHDCDPTADKVSETFVKIISATTISASQRTKLIYNFSSYL